MMSHLHTQYTAQLPLQPGAKRLPLFRLTLALLLLLLTLFGSAGGALAAPQLAPAAQELSCAEDPEQLDRDGDGILDVCDLTVILTGDPEPGQQTVILPSDGAPTRLILAYIDNYTETAASWQYRTSAEGLDSVTKGRAWAGKSIVASILIDPSRLGPGMYQTRGRLAVISSVAGVQRFDVTINIYIYESGDEPAEECVFDVRMVNAKVTDDQGIAEGKMEVRIEASADGNFDVWPSAGTNQKMKEGTTYKIDDILDSFVVAMGSQKVVDIDAYVYSEDSGATGADDSGFKSGEMTLECDVEPATLTLSVLVPGGALAENDGTVKIVFEADQR